ncbi:type I glyceraldehyde-3-phosphate dehydrogenase [Campylobacter corcagiensis]|uniref:Glyceraldehyde-3-phosphate dehydrogenase n=1 Tax=Campylobacter corcagiensis TaxID=1448857 RepID=A0A7M1LH38_9BACT|nr:type I glyceraldehyde-3-phosphate dehydrogenase [Campylobacter corcagiensis]QKF64164.1 glyceraldehyde 3-phosphate dehydrogenase A [Campylobacter corcagiensis]QOQ87641.1 type I glyceraldehyde-3-phosphate dehydrogenase [Campylobacter corcagiensis]
MALKIAINGFGRIGRCVARIILNRDDVELVAINDTAKREITRYLLKYDSVHGEFKKDVLVVGDDISVDGKVIKMSSTREPSEIDFNGADVVLECTGAFLTKESCKPYLDKGLNLVVMSAPAKDDTPTFVMGVNHELYSGEKIISNASCTTNGLAPVAKVLDDKFGIVSGLMTTTHAYTASQPLLDTKSKDFRKSRAAATNIIPTTTGAAKAIGLVLPNLKGKLNGLALRVPVADVSMVDLTAVLAKKVTTEEINSAFKDYAKKNPEILLFDEDFRVSSDFITSSYSSVVASDMTQIVDGNLVKVLAWYDNEWGYSSRLVDLAVYAAKKGLK